MSAVVVDVTFGSRRVQLPRADAEHALALLGAIDGRRADITLVLAGERYDMRLADALDARRKLQAVLNGRTS